MPPLTVELNRSRVQASPFTTVLLIILPELSVTITRCNIRFGVVRHAQSPIAQSMLMSSPGDLVDLKPLSGIIGGFHGVAPPLTWYKPLVEPMDIRLLVPKRLLTSTSNTLIGFSVPTLKR